MRQNSGHLRHNKELKMIKIAHIAALALLVTGAGAQTTPNGLSGDYASFLDNVASRSPQLTAAQKGHTATVRGLRTGLAPDDPEVGLEYYFDKETRYELVIEQAFDFPTVYHQRNKISKLGISKAEQEYRSTKRGIMAAASDAYLALNYAAERVGILSKRRSEMQEAVKLYKQGAEAGHISALEVHNMQIVLAEMETALVLAETEQEEAASALQQLNGGLPLGAQGYPQFGFSGTKEEFVAAALAADYELQASAIDTLIARRELKLSRNEWIPKLKVGYKIEMEGTRGTNAMLAGISVPLWQNSGKTKYAKAMGEAAKAQHVATEASTKARLASLYERYKSLSAALEARQHDRSCTDYPGLLKEAVEGGKITSIDGLLGLSEWYTMKDSVMELEYQMAQTGAMMAICLM